MHQQRQDSVNGRSYIVYLTVTNMKDGKISEVAELVLYRNDGNNLAAAIGNRDVFTDVLGRWNEAGFREHNLVPAWVRATLHEIHKEFPNAVYCVNLMC